MAEHLRMRFEPATPKGIFLRRTNPNQPSTPTPQSLANDSIIRYVAHVVPTVVRRVAHKSPAFPRKLILAWGNAMLACLDRSEAELSVLLTNDFGIRMLNREYRQKDRPTDVLSFHFNSGAGSTSAETEWLLGDVVISLDTATRHAEGRKRPLEEEVRWLLAHGLLHLCGYDHATPKEKRTMDALTRRLVRVAQAATVPTRVAKRPAKGLSQSPRRGSAGAR